MTLTAEIEWACEDVAKRVWVLDASIGVRGLDPEYNRVLAVALTDGLMAENAERVAGLDGLGHTNICNDCIDGDSPESTSENCRYIHLRSLR